MIYSAQLPISLVSIVDCIQQMKKLVEQLQRLNTSMKNMQQQCVHMYFFNRKSACTFYVRLSEALSFKKCIKCSLK